MQLTRRSVLAGLAVTSALVPAAYFGARKVSSYLEKFDGTPPPAQVEQAGRDTRRLSGRLSGIWTLKIAGNAAAIFGLPAAGLELLLDTVERGRALRGFIDTPENLRAAPLPRYKVVGDLMDATPALIRWRLMDRDSVRYAPVYEFTVMLDDSHALHLESGLDVLTGHIQFIDSQHGLIGPRLDVVMLKHATPTARQRIELSPQLQAWATAPENRLYHQLWHASRDRWHELSESRRDALRGLGWQPGPLGQERHARGRNMDRNGAGVDFFFMHRHMMTIARALNAPPAWRHFPLPQPAVEQDRAGFVRYFENADGFSVPPMWLSPSDEFFTEGTELLKTPEAFHANFQMWDSRYRDADYLSRLTLGQFGSEMELGLHDWLHIRWASVPRDPSDGAAVPAGRKPVDFSQRWFSPEYDCLVDALSSHVNPLFWCFHGWMDDRVEDWFDAHQRAHPGQVVRRRLYDVEWFEAGPWVEVAEPWMGPPTHGCFSQPGSNGIKPMEADIELMKLALDIACNTDEPTDALNKVPHRPAYARNLPMRGRQEL
ncbi:PvdJ/PvdD/PvdP-like protein [Pseudomonas sp. v388]|uniref:pyoverdine maturation tyrosinase PvdP n=1 Tax=Pseudomonas sp. v388 TaxID=2479849 RepID=UPI000F7A84B0|nr:PvdJ/PvdD/PvdP-like protein [Pseudomonas sp. v388]RRV10259.1 PvdJ/PvdD/PvdP-like protein [Pseudomonas sp. v388]